MRTVSISDDSLTVSEIVAHWPQTLTVFLKYKMLCVGCFVAPFHTVKEACAEHRLDEAAFRAALAAAIA